MTEVTNASAATHDAQHEYLEALIRHGLLVETGVAGVYGKGSSFETVLAAFDRYIGKSGEGLGAEVLRFPPVMNRVDFEHSLYLKSFPHFVGCVDAFGGNERDHREMLRIVESGGDWSAHFATTDLVLTPAACYPLYPLAAGALPHGGRLFDVQSYCFRHEPSGDPARMQMFRMHEFVRMSTPADVAEFRDYWLTRAKELLRAVGIEAEAVVANDPFFGRAGTMLAVNQVEKALKFELVAEVADAPRLTALVSCNYHQSHFGEGFGIQTSDGDPAHTACVGFGLERITLALYRTHGFQLQSWPSSVLAALEL